MIGSRAVLAVVSVLSGCASYAHVDGGIHVEKDISWFHIWFWSEDTSRVVIGPGSVVGGTLRFERKVNLYVSDRATIGRVEGATAVSFSGNRPPE